MYSNRVDRLRQMVESEGLDAIVISKIENLHYFSGFRGDDATIIITPSKKILITDKRYTEQAEKQADSFEIVEQTEGLWKKTAQVLLTVSCKNVGFEGKNISYDAYQSVAKNLEGVKFDKSINVDKLRQIKDSEEIKYIIKACEIADMAYTEVLKYIKNGLKEYEVALFLENCMRESGAEKTAFQTIVASGVRGSLPHGVPTDKVILEGEMVTLDFGAVFNGYHSDMTRTFCVGKSNERQREIYECVLEAQEKALNAIKAGVSGRYVDSIARKVLQEKGMEDYFVHGLGHSLGLEIHEEPRLSRLSDCEALMENMLVTDEPGIYIPNWGGVRIEDTVLVTKSGGKPLTKSKKDFIEIL